MQESIFRLFFVVIMGMGLNTFPMEWPEPMDIEPEGAHITLVSAEGKEFELPRSAAKRAGSIPSMLCVEVGFNEALTSKIEFKNIPTHTMGMLISFLLHLDQMVRSNEQKEPKHQMYIPRAYQPFLNQQLAAVDNGGVGALYQAADLLDIPFILNGVAAVIADRIHHEINTEEWEKLDIDQRRDKVNHCTQRFEIGSSQDYIVKHVTFRTCGITQEFSIADYIVAGGDTLPDHNDMMPPNMSVIRLNDQKLTSLFGIERLHTWCSCLNLSNNCFFDFSLDVQTIEQPFREFKNLDSICLNNNQLIDLPSDFCQGLGSFEYFGLDSNNLKSLPLALFNGFVKLKGVGLKWNPLSEQAKENPAIWQPLKEKYPNIEINRW